MRLDEIKRHVDGWLKTERAIRRLRQLDNYLLTDIGIERRDITCWVKGKCQP